MTSNADQPAETETPSEGTVKLLRRLERLPKAAVFLSVLIVTVGVLMAPGKFGAVLTLALAAGSGYLVYVTWPRNTAKPARLARVVVVLALSALGIYKLFL